MLFVSCGFFVRDSLMCTPPPKLANSEFYYGNGTKFILSKNGVHETIYIHTMYALNLYWFHKAKQ